VGRMSERVDAILRANHAVAEHWGMAPNAQRMMANLADSWGMTDAELEQARRSLMPPPAGPTS
jgi:hypothetical protein